MFFRICANMKILFGLIGSRLFIPRGSVFLNPSYNPPPLFDLVYLSFFFYFLFLEERDIKMKIKYIFIPDFNRGG